MLLEWNYFIDEPSRRQHFELGELIKYLLEAFSYNNILKLLVIYTYV